MLTYRNKSQAAPVTRREEEGEGRNEDGRDTSEAERSGGALLDRLVGAGVDVSAEIVIHRWVYVTPVVVGAAAGAGYIFFRWLMKRLG